MKNERYNVYISAYSTDGGIFQYVLDADGMLSLVGKTELDRPMYSVIEGNTMYAVLRAPFENGDGGLVSMSLNKDGVPTLNDGILSTHGDAVCHLAVSDGQVYCVNYLSGSVIKMSDKIVTHEGHGINPLRQEKAHAHFVGFSPDGKYVCVTDLGLDKVFFYTKNLEYAFDVSVPAGSGVRHIVFSADGSLMYCINELDATISVFRYDDKNTVLLHTYGMLPPNFKEKNTAAAIRIHGDKLYASNRGHDSIACFGICGEELELKYIKDCGGKGPRDFNIFGDYLICANEDSDNVTIFRLESDDMEKLDYELILPHPLCVDGRKI